MVAPTPNSGNDKAATPTKPLRFLEDRRVRSQKAAADAIRVSERLEAGQTEELSETELFAAYQACAYRASGKHRGKKIPPAESAQWLDRWKRLRDYIVEQNLGLVYTMILRFKAKHLDWDEQRSEAYLAMVRAVDGFNPWSGFRFSTYACNAITRSLIHLSKRTNKYRARFPLEHEAWLERPTRSDGWAELFADRLRRALENNLGELTEREAVVLGWRFPLRGGRSLTLGEIGDAIGLSKERARQIQDQALNKLREVLEADPALQ